MSRLHRLHLIAIPPLILGMVALWPSPADAQRRRVPVRSVVVVSGGYGYPWYPYYGPFFAGQLGYPWGPWGPPGMYGYPVRDQLTSSIRLEVTPRDAEVFVDGYSAGRVDDFDGIFQRLRVRPGNHELTLYKPGFKTVRQSLYLGPNADQKIKFAMEPLSAGEASEPPPPPSQPAPGGQAEPGFPFDEPFGEPPPQGPPPQGPPPGGAPPPQQVGRFGTLSVRVQPADAEILVDGERWNAPSDQDRLTIQLAEGRHHVEIRKSGFSTYREDVLIRPNRSLTLNVSLLRGDGDGR